MFGLFGNYPIVGMVYILSLFLVINVMRYKCHQYARGEKKIIKT